MALGKSNVTYEAWKQVSTGTMEGNGRVMQRETGEVRSTESMRLVEMSGDVFMLPKAEHNELPIAFKLVKCSEREAIFENKAHDFPTQLKYNHIGQDSMYVSVSDGGTKGFVLRFGRAPN